MFITQKSGNKTSLGQIGLNIRTHANPKVGQEQVSGGINVLSWHAASVANILWRRHAITQPKHIFELIFIQGMTVIFFSVDGSIPRKRDGTPHHARST